MRELNLHSDPPPVGIWTSLNRVLLTLIVVTALGVLVYRFLPETARRKEQAAVLADLRDKVEKQKQKLAYATRKADLLTRDKELIELIARDRLDLQKTEEKVYRLEAPGGGVAPVKKPASKGK